MRRRLSGARIGAVVVGALTRTVRGLVSEPALTAAEDGVPSDCVANSDEVHTIRRELLRRPVTELSPRRMDDALR
jgi:mRNA interferase MazF